MHIRLRSAATLAGAAAMALAASTVHANEINLPQTITMTAYSLGSGSYNEVVAIGAALKRKYGKDFRIIPANNDVARLTPLRSGQVQLSAMGSAVYFAQEGLYEFGDANWGPQAFHVIGANLPNQAQGPYVSARSGINSMADLKGKRVPRVRNAPSLTSLMQGYLAFGGLGWDDVEVVEVAGFMPMLQAFMQGQIDVAIAASLSTVPQRAHSSPVGPIKWLPMPHDDKEGWKRLQAIVPYNQPIRTNNGVSLGGDNWLEGATYPLPVLIAYPDNVDDEMAYNLAKIINELFDEYKDTTPSSHGYKPTKAHFDTIHPYHPGAIRYFKEIGLWGAEEDERQARNLKRQEVLTTAWKAHKDSTSATGPEFRAAWLKARTVALKEAGFETFTDD